MGSTTTAGILWKWDGACMRPTAGHQSRASIKFVQGRTYRLEERDRSAESHDHYMACVQKVWENLPEGLPYKWANVTEMRRWALIQAGYFDEVKIPCEDLETAGSVSLKMKKMLRAIDKYSQIDVGEEGMEDFTLIIWVARSQSYSAMTRKEFEASKEAVLRLLGEIIGTTPEQLLEEGRHETQRIPKAG
jgi:hypothetical protein